MPQNDNDPCKRAGCGHKWSKHYQGLGVASTLGTEVTTSTYCMKSDCRCEQFKDLLAFNVQSIVLGVLVLIGAGAVLGACNNTFGIKDDHPAGCVKVWDKSPYYEC